MFIVGNQEKHCFFAFSYASLKRNSRFVVKISKFFDKGSFRILKSGNPAFEFEWIKHSQSRLWYKEDVYIVDNQEKTLLICFFLRVAEEEFSIRSQNLKSFDNGSFRILKSSNPAFEIEWKTHWTFNLWHWSKLCIVDNQNK